MQEQSCSFTHTDAAYVIGALQLSVGAVCQHSPAEQSSDRRWDASDLLADNERRLMTDVCNSSLSVSTNPPHTSARTARRVCVGNIGSVPTMDCILNCRQQLKSHHMSTNCLRSPDVCAVSSCVWTRQLSGSRRSDLHARSVTLQNNDSLLL